MQEKESTQQKCENQMNELCATLEKYKVNSLTSLKYIFTFFLLIRRDGRSRLFLKSKPWIM